MSLSATLDLTKVVTTTISTVETATSVETVLGVISTQLGSQTTSTLSTVFGTGLIGERGAPGKSAYAVWVAEGNTGTEQDFLDSLVSTVPAPQGVQGPVGPKVRRAFKALKGIPVMLVPRASRKHRSYRCRWRICIRCCSG